MNPYDIPALAAVLDGASRLLDQLASQLDPVAGPSAAALAIVLVTLLVRAVLIPVGVSQRRAQRTRARLAPVIRSLQQRHRSDPERLQQELSALYASEKTSPLAGCLPLLAQAPVLAVVYAVFSLPMVAGHANPLLAHTLLGAPLGQGLIAAAGAGSVPGLAVGGAVVALVLVLVIATRSAQRRTALLDAPGSPAGGDGAQSLAGGPGLAGALSWLPLVSVVFAAFAPLAAALYLATSMSWTLVERTVLAVVLPS